MTGQLGFSVGVTGPRTRNGSTAPATPSPVARNAVRQALPGHNDNALGTAAGNTAWTATYVNESGAAITTASLVFVGWRITTSGYAAVGNDVPTSATISYNGGSAVMTAGGSSTIMIPNDGQVATDAVALGFPIPAGATFTVSGTQTLVNGQKYARSGSVACGIAGVRTHVDDRSKLKRESLYFIGDSIMTNNGAAVLTAAAGRCPCVGHSIAGTRASHYAGGFARAAALFEALGCTTMVSNFGTNSLGTAAGLIAETTALRDPVRAVGGKFAQATLLPRVSSANVAVSSLISIGTTATASVPDASKFIVGQFYTVVGANEAAYNGGMFIESRDLLANTVSFAFPGNGDGAATGTITLRGSYAARELMAFWPQYEAGPGSQRGLFNAWVRGGNVDAVLDWGDAAEVERDDGLWARGGDKPELTGELTVTVASSPTSTTTITYTGTTLPVMSGLMGAMVVSGSQRGTRLTPTSTIGTTGFQHNGLPARLAVGDTVRLALAATRASDDGLHPRTGIPDNSGANSKGGQLLLVNATKAWIDARLA